MALVLPRAIRCSILAIDIKHSSHQLRHQDNVLSLSRCWSSCLPFLKGGIFFADGPAPVKMLHSTASWLLERPGIDLEELEDWLDKRAH